MPPIMGAAIRFMTSAPVPVDYMIGTNPMNIVATVMNLGWIRWMAPTVCYALVFRNIVDRER